MVGRGQAEKVKNKNERNSSQSKETFFTWGAAGVEVEVRGAWLGEVVGFDESDEILIKTQKWKFL